MIHSDPLSHFLFSIIIITSFKYKITPDEDDRVQYDDWNPLNGIQYSEQQNARSSTRGRAVCGTTSSSLPQVRTNNNYTIHFVRRKANRDITGLLQESPRNTRRSRRNNTTSETSIDFTDSDSEGGDIVVEDNQSVEVSSWCCFLVALIFFFSFFFFYFVNPSFFLNQLDVFSLH
jgi:hypothetical protein